MGRRKPVVMDADWQPMPFAPWVQTHLSHFEKFENSELSCFQRPRAPGFRISRARATIGARRASS